MKIDRSHSLNFHAFFFRIWTVNTHSGTRAIMDGTNTIRHGWPRLQAKQLYGFYWNLVGFVNRKTYNIKIEHEAKRKRFDFDFYMEKCWWNFHNTWMRWMDTPLRHKYHGQLRFWFGARLKIWFEKTSSSSSVSTLTYANLVKIIIKNSSNTNLNEPHLMVRDKCEIVK